MLKTWENQNVNLKVLTQQIAKYLESSWFEEITAVEAHDEYRITAENSSRDKRLSDVLVVISGRPNEFSVSLESCNEPDRFNFPVILSAMFGGGYFLLRSLKSSESWQGFERSFWQSVSSIVERLRDSADCLEKPTR